jgi:bacteriorhodopsin
MAYEYAGHAGRVAFWIIFGIMAGASLLFLAMAMLASKKASNRLGARDHAHHYLTWIIVTIAALAYFAMATNTGYEYVAVNHHTNTSRTIYWARYIDWALTTPLLLLDLILLGHLSVHHTARVIFCDIAMILCGLFGALLTSDFKWGWYGIGCGFMLIIFYDLLISIRGHVNRRDSSLGAPYTILALWLIIVWALYPVVWGFAEGSNTISVFAEIICYGVLDVLAKVLFGLLLLLTVARHVSKRGNAPLDGSNAYVGGPVVREQYVSTTTTTNVV